MWNERLNYNIEDFEKDPSWIPSLGEKLDKVHFRNGHYHAECDPKTGNCEIHYDEIDPYENPPESILNHMWQSDLGKITIVGAGLTILDELFNKGKGRKALKDWYNDFTG